MKVLLLIASLLLPALVYGQDSCSKACVISTECGTGGLCVENQCKYKKSFCFNERWAANERGETSNCDAYRCSPDSGQCLRNAESSDDCLPGYVFNGTSACVPSVACNSPSADCQDLWDRWKKTRDEYESTTPQPVMQPWTCVACEDSSTCGAGKMCWHKRCVSASSYCEVDSEGGHHQVALPDRFACGNYACEKVSGECLKSCLKESDCRSGRKCVAGQCQ